MPVYEYHCPVCGVRNQHESEFGLMILLVQLICLVYGQRFWSWEYLCRN